MNITTCTKKPHTDPRVLAMASEKKQPVKTNQWFLLREGEAGECSRPARRERERERGGPVHVLVHFKRVVRAGGASLLVPVQKLVQTELVTELHQAATSRTKRGGEQTLTGTQMYSNTHAHTQRNMI